MKTSDLRTTNDRPDSGNPNAAINYSDACLNSTSCITGVGQLQPNGSLVDFNTGAPGTRDQFRYIVVSGRPGNTGRNTLVNDWTQDYAFSVERIFPYLIWSIINWSSGLRVLIRLIIRIRVWFLRTYWIPDF